MLESEDAPSDFEKYPQWSQSIKLPPASKNSIKSSANKVFVDSATSFDEEGAQQVYFTVRDKVAVLEDTNAIGMKKIINEIRTAHGDRLDGLRMDVDAGALDPFELSTEDVFNKLFNTNVKGAYFAIQNLLPAHRDGSSSGVGRNLASTCSSSLTSAKSFVRTLSSDLLPPLQLAGGWNQVGGGVALGIFGTCDELTSLFVV